MAEGSLLPLGALVGLVLGLTGAGGSVLAVPLLMLVLDWSLARAAPVALAAVCVAAAFGTWASWDVRRVRYRAALWMALFGAALAPLGLWLARQLPPQGLELLFGMVMALVALRLWRQALVRPEETRVVRAAALGAEVESTAPLCRVSTQTGRFEWTPGCAALLGGIGGGAGLLSGLLGVGGGFFIVPSLRAATTLGMHSAVATSLMTIALTSGAGTLFSLRELPWALAAWFAAGALGGMALGRPLAARLAGPVLQKGFALLMALVAVSMFYKAGVAP